MHVRKNSYSLYETFRMDEESNITENRGNRKWPAKHFQKPTESELEILQDTMAEWRINC